MAMKMKTDLKTNMKFQQVSKRYYLPENEIELASLTRFEKVPAIIMENAGDGARKAALDAARIINDCIAKRGRAPKRMGRPKVHIDMEILIRMVGDDCTNADIGSALGVSVRTVNRVKKSLKN